MHRKPTIFADETLFSSCKHIYSPAELAEIIMEMHRNHEHTLLATCQAHEADVGTLILRHDDLTRETIQLLRRYEGSKVKVKGKPPGRSNHIGIIQKVVTVASVPKLSVIWRHNALTTNISMDELFAKYDIIV
jgi:uncharacterized protein YbgA (DUF1722 family)